MLSSTNPSSQSKQLRAIIVEDIPHELAYLKECLAQNCPQVEVVGATGQSTQALQLIREHEPDLLLLDIEIDQGTSYDLLDQLQRQGIRLTCEIIFMTGHPKFDYATTAFAYSALDFLTKPIDPQHLQKAIARACERPNWDQYARQLNLLMDLVRSPEPRSNRLALHQPGGVIEFIDIDQILYLEADGVTTQFMMQDGRLMLAMRNIGQYSKLLERHGFFPISQSIMVNLDQLKRYDHAERVLTLNNGKTLYASRRGGQDLRHYLNQSIQETQLSSNPLIKFFEKIFRL